MPRITLAQAQSWAEPTKLTMPALDEELLAQIESEVLARIGGSYDTTPWISYPTTPLIVSTAIAKMYVAYYYNRAYSENQGEPNDYASILLVNAEMIITGIIAGTIDVPGVVPLAVQSPTFYPTDASSALQPTSDDPSLGPARFSMGMVF